MPYPKITNADTDGRGVVGLPDTPGLPAYQLQQKFDELVNAVIIPKFNELSNMLDAVITDGSTVDLSAALLTTDLVRAGESLDSLANKLNIAYRTKIASALQGVKIDGSAVTPDANGVVNINLAERIGDASQGVTGVKGESESTYRTGAVTITRTNLGLGAAAVKGVSSSPTVGDTNLITGGAVASAIRTLYALLRASGAHNYIPFPYTDTTKTVNGITFVVGTDGTVTASGTATADAIFLLGLTPMPKGSYYVSGCPYVGANKCAIIMDGSVVDSGNGSNVITANSDTSKTFALRVNAGTTVTNAVFSPLLRLASDTDTDFSLYAMTNRVLTEKAIKAKGDIEDLQDDVITANGNISSLQISVSNLTQSIKKIVHVSSLPASPAADTLYLCDN